MEKITLKSLHCTLNDEVDKDEVYLKLNGKKIWPSGFYKQIGTGERIDINYSFESDEDVIEIELWDFDLLSRNDLLGKFIFKPAGEKGNFSTSMRTEDMSSTASYFIEWSVKP